MSDIEAWQRTRFAEFLDAQLLPRNLGSGETTATYSALKVVLQPQYTDLLIPATWPTRWKREPSGDGNWFVLRDDHGAPVIEGMVSCKPYEQKAFMRLTPWGRQKVRRHWRELPAWKQTLHGRPWATPFRTIARGFEFSEEQTSQLPVLLDRLRTLGWNTGSEMPSGIQIVLSDRAGAWNEEREAGEAIWLLPGSSSPELGCTKGQAYPWHPLQLQSSWNTPTAVADEIDLILRHGHELWPRTAAHAD